MTTPVPASHCLPPSPCPFLRPAALALAALLLAMLGFRTIAAFPSFFVEDDAWYYMQIAYNLGTSGESTFDGIHTTSGYHLAWAGLLGLVSAATSLLSPDQGLFVLAAIAVYFLLGLVAVEYFGRGAMEKAALLAFVFYPGLLMESQLLAVALLTVAHFFLAEEESPLARAAMLLVPLTRIDATVMLVPLILYQLARGQFADFKKSCLFTGLGVVAHFGVMFLAFGRLASVSSLAKAHWSSQTGLAEIVRANVVRYGRYELGVAVAMLFLALAAAWAARREGRGLRVLAVIAGPAAFLLVHVIANPILRSWYFSPALFLFALVLIRSKAKAVRTAFFVLVCALVVREARNASFFIRDDAATLRAENSARFLADVRRIVPDGEPIFQIDGCGYTGFFSRRPIVNGDGLMNTYDYLARLEADGLADYLREKRIRYVITNSPVSGDRILDHRGLVLRRGDVEKAAESANQEAFCAFALWRIRDAYFAPRKGGGASQ